MKNNTLKRGAPKRGLAAHPAVIAAQIGYSVAQLRPTPKPMQVNWPSSQSA